jgi:hypothetical protein
MLKLVFATSKVSADYLPLRLRTTWRTLPKRLENSLISNVEK